MKQTNIYAHQCLAKPPKKGEKHMAFEDLTVPVKNLFRFIIIHGNRPETREDSNILVDSCCHFNSIILEYNAL